MSKRIIYYSTAGNAPETDFAGALIQGQPVDRGLYLPKQFPQLDLKKLKPLAERSFRDLAIELAGLWLDGEFDEELWKGAAEEAFSFDVKLTEVCKNRSVLELFHGPTLSFKDVGARFLAAMLDRVLKERGETATILTATSGDTGSAVADACAARHRLRAVVLYPKGQISSIQEHQIAMRREGVSAVGVHGTFDDCQELVKAAMADPELAMLKPTSANSINVGRFVPQTFYYVYCALLSGGALPMSVPSGNFGNLTAGLIAKRQGAPIDLIASTNANDVVPRYLESGSYDPRPSVRTYSSAMDVGDPSNFRRIRKMFKDDAKAMRGAIFPAVTSDDETLATIREVYEQHGYILDPHGAVAWRGASQWRASDKGRDTMIVSLCTAHPAKFQEAVERAIGEKPEIPTELKKQLEEPMTSHEIENDYAEFKDYLKRL